MLVYVFLSKCVPCKDFGFWIIPLAPNNQRNKTNSTMLICQGNNYLTTGVDEARTGYEVLKQCFPHNLCLEQCLQYLTQCFRCASINCSHPAFDWTISTIWWQQILPQVQWACSGVSINLKMEGKGQIETTVECRTLTWIHSDQNTF